MILRRVTGWPSWDWSSPFDELDRMRRQMDLLSEGLTRGVWREPTAGVFPLMNVTEEKDSYYVRAELPGIKADELEISVTGDTLSISGERKIPGPQALKSLSHTCRERTRVGVARGNRDGKEMDHGGAFRKS